MVVGLYLIIIIINLDMKFIAIIALVVVIASAMPSKAQMDMEVSAKLGRLPENIFGVIAEGLYKQLREEHGDVEPTPNGHGYDVARTLTGCVSGSLAFVDTVFTDVDIIMTDPENWEVYLFAVLYLYAWYQQNGPFTAYMCRTFWELIHEN
jgi:hypothetical protein